MIRRSAGPASPAFERIVRDAQFRDRIAIVVKASPPVIFQALHDVAFRDMKLAWALGEIRYLPSRLGGHMPPVQSARSFLSVLVEGGTHAGAGRPLAASRHERCTSGDSF